VPPFNPNGESNTKGCGVPSGLPAVTIGLGAALFRVDTLTPRLHEI
jgi:hypothetical protein